MQGQQGSPHSFVEAFEFENGSTSSNEHHIYWNNMANSGGSQSLRDYLSSSAGHSDVTYMDAEGHHSSSSNAWTFGSASSGPQAGHNDVKTDDEWTVLSINAGSPPSLEGRQREGAISSLDNVNITLHTSFPSESLVHQDSNDGDMLYPSDINSGFAGTSIERLVQRGSDFHQYRPSASVARQVHIGSSSDHGGSSSGTAGDLVDDDNGRSAVSMDGRRLSCKRKSLEMGTNQLSLNGSSSLQVGENTQHALPSTHDGLLNHPVPTQHSASVSSVGEFSATTYGGSSSGAIPLADFSLATGNDGENSHRSFRMRMNPTYPQQLWPSRMLPSENSSRSSYWPPHSSPSSRVFPSSRSVGLRSVIPSTISSHNEFNAQHLSGFSPSFHSLGWNAALTSRTGSSSNSGERPISLHEDANTRALPRSISHHVIFPSPGETRYLSADPADWSSTSGNVTATNDITSQPVPNAGWVSTRRPLPHLSRRSLDVRRSLFSSSGSESGTHSSPLPPSGSVPTSSSAEVVLPSSAGVQRHPHHHLRSALLLDRQGDGIFGMPLSWRNMQAATEGRISLVSEIRSALDRIHRESIRFEDVLILEQSVFFGGANLHDRHRDMRLDVDNMSYEELLALEERIGNVSTGLSEETIMKCLKQRRHSSSANEKLTELEPCCICQEEYVDDELLGMLDCGHDFHTDCIKQWLLHKNLCPICKMTAMVTT